MSLRSFWKKCCSDNKKTGTVCSLRHGGILRVEELEDRRLLSVSPLETPLASVWQPSEATPTVAYSIASNAEDEWIASASLSETINARLTAAGQSPSNLTEGYIFNLNSCPDSTYTIYLDFNGHTTTGTEWNTNYASTFDTPVYNTDGNTLTFSNAELLEIYEIWLRVSEDYMPFGVNVTTAEPTAAALIKADSTDTAYGVRCCMGGESSDWLGEEAGGIAYLGSFDWDSDTPCFAFQASVKSIAEAASHEVGHTLGLSHDGSSLIAGQSQYYQGADGWAPIMGAGYYQSLTQWSRGEYAGATNNENDLTMITSNGFTYRADDHGDTLESATSLTMAVSGTLASGIIEQNTDVDSFCLTLAGEQTRLVIGGMEEITNLDVTVSLYDSTQTLLRTYNPSAWTNVVIDVSGFAAGTYYLTVAGAGLSRDGNMIYSDYASLGAYTIIADAAGNYGDVPNSIDRAAEFEWNGIDGSHTDVIGNYKSTESGGVTYYYDVDMYRIDVGAADVNQDYTISFTETATTKTGKCLRIFDAAGNEQFFQQQMGDIVDYVFTPTVAGTYYIGASYYSNSAYTPTEETGVYTNFTPFEATVSVVRPSTTNELARVTLSTDSPQRGETLTAYVNPSAATVSWQWYRVDGGGNVALISGATGASYTVTTADVGYSIRVTATGTGDYSGTVSATSANAAYDPTRVTTLNSTSTATDGVVSLQEAIRSALAGTFGTTVTFDATLSGRTITLDGWAIDLTGGITIDASSLWNSTTNAPGITIDGNNASQIFTVKDNTVDTPVSLIGLTLTGGYSTRYGGIIWNDGFLSLTDCEISNGTSVYSGAGIYNVGSATLTDCTVSGNKTTSTQNVANGGGIYNNGTLTVEGGVISGNTTTQDGGGIYNDANGTLTATGCEISNGMSVYSGAGIYNVGSATLTDCTVSGNETTTTSNYVADGAGIYNTGIANVIGGTVSGNTSIKNGGGLANRGGTLTVADCVISGNSAGQYGAGLYNYADTVTGSLTIVNSLIYDNTTTSYGGGICNWGNSVQAKVTLRNVTITGNSAEYGGGYMNLGDTDTGTFYNSIIANNTTNSGNDVFNNSTSVVEGYNNLSSFNAWNAATSGNNLTYNTVDPLFVDMANNDYRIVGDSAAFNAGNNIYAIDAQGVALETDLAGNTRIDNGTVDLGAYEYAVDMTMAIRLTDAFDAANYLTDDGTTAAWYCGQAVSNQASISILQNEHGEAKLILQAETGSNLRWKFNETNAGTYWSATSGADAGGTVSTILTWKTNATATRLFTITVWEDLDNDGMVDGFEGSRTLTVNVEWANFTLCAAMADINSAVTATFNYIGGSSVTDLIDPAKLLVNFGHAFYDNRASGTLLAALSSSGISDAVSRANTIWGYYNDGSYFYQQYQTASPSKAFAQDGNVVSPGHCIVDPAPSSVYKTYTVTSLSGYVALLALTDEFITNPGTYRMVADSNGPSSQCTDHALAAMAAAQLNPTFAQVNESLPLPEEYVRYVRDLSAADRAIYDDYAPYFSSLINGQTGTAVNFYFTGYSPSSVGYDIKNSGGTVGNYQSHVVTSAQVTPVVVSTPILLIDDFSVAANALSVDLAWEGIIGATGYTVAWREAQGEWSSTNQITVTNISETISGLVASRGYEFRVQATDGTNVSEWSQTVSYFSQGTVTVTTGDDTVSAFDGVVSLREALSGFTDGRNAYCASTILFDTTVFTAENSTITLSGSQLAITRSLTIDASANRAAGVYVTIDASASADDARRVILVDDGMADVSSQVVLNALTITGGYVVGDGGGVLNQEILTVTDCVFSGNTAKKESNAYTVNGGGGIYSNGAMITVSGSLFNGNDACEGGGGLCVNSGVLSLVDSEFRANTVSNLDFKVATNTFYYTRYDNNFGNARGGGVHIGRQATGVISGTLFTQNSVRGWFSQGAGLYLDLYTGESTASPSVTVDSCAFTWNESVGDSAESYDVSGGGIYANYNRTSSVTNCYVANNLGISCAVDANGNRVADDTIVSVEDSGGGGIYNDGTMNISHCAIIDNGLTMMTHGGQRANGNGIGARFGGGGFCGISGLTNIYDCTITDNTVKVYTTIEHGLLGGGGVVILNVNNTNLSLNVVNTLIASNHVYDYSSGTEQIGSIGGGLVALAKTTIRNCTITNNDALIGSGVYVITMMTNGGTPLTTGDLTVYNSIIAGNNVGADVARYANESVKAFNTLSTYTTWDTGTDNLTYAGGTLFADPLNGDYRLAVDSLAVDAGNNSNIADGVTTDLAQQRRVINTTVDLGAYEYVYTRTVTTHSATGTGSLTEAITNIETGGTILFDSHLANTTVTLDSSTAITLDKEITLDGSNCLDGQGNATVTIAGNNARLFIVSAGSTQSPVELVGLILSGGTGTGAVTADNGNGGAILVETGKALAITNCTVRSNTANGYGGAIYLKTGADLTATGTRFESNVATTKNGGAIFAAESSTVTITDTTFSGNRANNGGALCVYGTATLGSENVADRVVFGSETAGSENSAIGKGGAIFGYGTITATNVEFLNNSAGKTGGAVYNTTRQIMDDGGNVLENRRGEVTLTNSVFSGNTADADKTSSSDFGHGGALANWGVMTITGCTFDMNSASRGGGAIVNGNSNLVDYPTMMAITDSTFTRNSARIGGAVNNIGTLSLTGCTFGGVDSSLGNLAESNGGALCNGTSGLLNFVDTTKATSFLNNTALNWGGGMITAGTIGFPQGNMYKPYFEGNTAGAGSGFGNAIANGDDRYRESANYFAYSAADPAQTVYQYGGTAAISSEGVLPLAAAQAGDTLLLDLDGSGNYVAYEALTPKALGLNAGLTKIAFQYRDGDDLILAEGDLNLTVFVQSPTITVYGESLADGRVLKLALDLCFTSDRTIGDWIVHWGDGTSTSSDSMARTLKSVHYYAPQTDDAEYSVYLELIDTDGFGEGTTYLVARHTVLGNGESPVVETSELAADTFRASAAPVTAPLTVSAVLTSEKPHAALILPENALFALMEDSTLPQPLDDAIESFDSPFGPYETLPMSACDIVWSEDDFSLTESDFDRTDSENTEPLRRGELLEAVWGETF